MRKCVISAWPDLIEDTDCFFLLEFVIVLKTEFAEHVHQRPSTFRLSPHVDTYLPSLCVTSDSPFKVSAACLLFSFFFFFSFLFIVSTQHLAAPPRCSDG